MKLQELHEIFIKHPEGKWVLGLQDSYRLYNIVTKLKPKKILDLGSGIGCSASVMALALKDLGAKPKGGEGVDIAKDYIAEIDSVEQFRKCWEIARSLVPIELQEYIDFSLAKPMLTEISGIPYQKFSIFSELPLDDYDLVVIDGPGPWIETINGERHLIKFPNGDFAHLLDHLKEGSLIYLDERKDVEKIILRYFQDYLQVVNATPEFTLFIRTGAPFKLGQALKDELEKQIVTLDYSGTEVDKTTK